jgi:Large polyvalent protein-associated domain 7
VTAIVIRSFPASGLARSVRYLTHDARHLALETDDGASLAAKLEQFRAIDAAAPLALAVTQLAVSLAPNEDASVDELFAAARALLAHPAVALDARPYFCVVHNERLLHAHIEFTRRDPHTGEVYPLGRLARALWEAAHDVAPTLGLVPPPADARARRREPRRARSLGVWHGERSRYAWLAERVAPAVSERIAGAHSAAQIGALLAEYGLQYVRGRRGGVLLDHSADPPRGVPASALAFALALPVLEDRFGPLPAFPVPADARTNPRAYGNDDAGRRLALGSDAERRAFAAEHAAWRVTWLPVREARARDQRATQAQRKAELAQRLAVLRAARDATATTRPERRLANTVIEAYRRGQTTALHERAAVERRDLAALPFAQRPPGRLLEWLRQREETPPDPARLSAPHGAPATAPLAPGQPLGQGRTVAGIVAGTCEWWQGRRRVAVDRGNDLRICHASALADALAVGAARWGRVEIGGDPAFRALAERAAQRAGVPYQLGVPAAAPSSFALPVVPAHRAIRVATAIAQHLGRPITLDGRPFEPAHAERHPRALHPEDDRPATIGFTQPVIVLRAQAAAFARLEHGGIVPALVAGDRAVVLLDRAATPAERDRLAGELRALGGLEIVDALIAGEVRYGPVSTSPYVARRLAALRPRRAQVTYEQRVAALEAFFARLEPGPGLTSAPAGAPPGPRAARGRARGGRAR